MGAAKSMPVNYDWLGLATISVLIALSEWFSLDLYARQTSISTSAIPILVAFLIFGPIGTVVLVSFFSVSLVEKYRSQFSRFIFNLSNHLLVGSLCLGLLMLADENCEYKSFSSDYFCAHECGNSLCRHYLDDCFWDEFDPAAICTSNMERAVCLAGSSLCWDRIDCICPDFLDIVTITLSEYY